MPDREEIIIRNLQNGAAGLCDSDTGMWKYRFNKLDFGEIAGLPRLMDVGQCNDVYSAVRIATALADAFNTDVNGLPLSMIVSWYEQKAVADLLALLSLGVRNIYLGPTLPAF